MGKGRKGRNNRKKRKPNPPTKPTGRQPGTSGKTPLKTEPTPEQLARLDKAQTQAEALTAEHGAPLSPVITEPVAATLEESLKRVEELLATTQGHFEVARKIEEESKTHADQLAEQMKEQKASLDKLQRDTDSACEARKEDLDRAEEELLQRIEACEAREAAAAKREADLLDIKARLTERELNAEQGFLREKAQSLKPLEEEVARLRGERDQLLMELAERRSEAEEKARTRASDRAEKWAEEAAQRTAQEAAARRKFDEEMIQARQDELTKLREMLRDEREEAESQWATELAERRTKLDARATDLDEQKETLEAELLKLHRDQQDLQADQEMLDEDRAALERKVTRLVEEQTEDLRHEADSIKKQLKDARTQRDAYFADLEARRELDRRFGDRKPEQILADLADLESKNDALTQQLRERPDVRAAERLAELERERSAWLEERAVLQGDLAKAGGELATRRLAAIELEALKKQKEALEVHKQLLDGAVDELRARVDELTRQDDLRNPMTALASLDGKDELQSEVRTTTPFGRYTPTLREFADDLRHRLAQGVEGRTLYYAERDVRAFLGGLAMTRLVLLQGISGTGKTSLPLAFASAVGAGIEVIEVQAGWRDRQDLIGYYNAFHRHYYATNFLQALYRAGTPAYRDRLFMMVLDEINLSRPEQFFADFLSALEQPMGDRKLTLVNDPVTNAPRLMVDGRHLPIPPNVWFVGTANHDESTAEFADKTYDRALVMEMPRKTEVAQFKVKKKGKRNAISYPELAKAFSDAANKHADAVQKATVWLRDAPFAVMLGQRFRVGWGNRLENHLACYLPVVVEAGGSVGEAMDHLLASKILRKLKDRHDVRASGLEDLQIQILEAWEKLDKSHPPERCDALIGDEITAKKGEELV